MPAPAPAIKNLKSTEFAEENADKTKSEVERLQSKISKLNAQIDTFEQEKRMESFRKYCEENCSGIASEGLRKIICGNFPKIMELAYESDRKNSRDASQYLKEIKQLITKISKTALTENFSENGILRDTAILGEALPLSPLANFEGRKVDTERLELHRRTLELLRANPASTYESALNSLLAERQ